LNFKVLSNKEKHNQMNSFINQLVEDKSALIGLVFLGISLLFFGFTMNTYDTSFDALPGIFFITYGITVLYFFTLMSYNHKKHNRYLKYRNFGHNVIGLQLFNISAYSLNRSIPVFHASVNWLIGFLIITNIALIYQAIRRDYKPSPVSHLIVALSTIAFIFHLYQSIYVGMFYPMTVMSFWFFGISLHTFVPLLFTIAFGIVLSRFLKQSSAFRITAIISLLVTIAFIADFSTRYYHINEVITESFHQENEPYNDGDLPSWVNVSQQLPKNWITERALKSGLVYTNMDNVFSSFMPTDNLNERTKHDPLLVLADLFVQGFEIPYKDKLKILRFMYDKRHQTERKLWSGDNLSTSDIVTNVQLFPEYRLSYTEKVFKIHNSQVGRWSSSEEALYTFYLPEGSVVTSAALWVNGKEEPAYLTTKGKADSAYTTIVGRERRDPLLLHWQEGNRVTVRVFPCTQDEDRTFKIGVTTPLKWSDNQLYYENIDFEGPYWKKAKESIHIVTTSELTGFSAPHSFKQEGMTYQYEGKYKSDWSLNFDATPLSTATFSFNERAFQLQKRPNTLASFSAKRAYLDINAGWTKTEFEELWQTMNSKMELWVYSNNRFEQLTDANKKALFKNLRKKNFTLFPFYKTKNDSETLVITKYNQLTPTLSDLKKTGFSKATSEFFKMNTTPIRVYNLGEKISPYMRTLSEFRSIQLEVSSLETIISNTKTSQFAQQLEDEKTILNSYADFLIKEVPYEASKTSTAPDHLMRLFTYNNVLKSVGKNHFHLKALENELIKEAQEAYVVTPISSLLVLESQADYDRFDIKKSKNSLDNASISNSGSVPEPHEWILILLVAMLTLYFYLKK
jgi:XrtN system VIT domain protein